MPILHPGPRAWVRAERERLAALRFERIGVAPLGTTVGAEISGVDLSHLDEATFAEIERAFAAYKVIFFRDQDITTEDHLAFARRFGELEEHPFIPAKPGYEQIVQFKKNERVIGVENIWHHDVTWRLRPSLGSVLRAIDVPGDRRRHAVRGHVRGLRGARRRRQGEDRRRGRRARLLAHVRAVAMTPEKLAEQQRAVPARAPPGRAHPSR